MGSVCVWWILHRVCNLLRIPLSALPSCRAEGAVSGLKAGPTVSCRASRGGVAPAVPGARWPFPIKAACRARKLRGSGGGEAAGGAAGAGIAAAASSRLGGRRGSASPSSTWSSSSAALEAGGRGVEGGGGGGGAASPAGTPGASGAAPPGAWSGSSPSPNDDAKGGGVEATRAARRGPTGGCRVRGGRGDGVGRWR